MIRRRGQEKDELSSSDEEDAFAALSRKNNAKRSRIDIQNDPSSHDGKKGNVENAISVDGNPLGEAAREAASLKLPAVVTSSMKRHHKPSDVRKAKMEALLLELEEEKGRQKKRDPWHFVPEKKGSFVGPGEEKLTSNLFVGNLAPSITEEDLSNLFSQFGDLYSLKIMWPRTMEERQRGRNTGFVCFKNREDAEEALESCNDTDPFNVGRLLTMGWGKNVKKNVTRGTEGLIESIIPDQPAGRTRLKPNDYGDSSNRPNSELNNDFVRPDGLPHVITLGKGAQDRSIPDPFDAQRHSTGSIRVEAPIDPERVHFISTVASYVAKDGVAVEKRLRSEEKGNALFNFLSLENADEQQRKEYLFYRWRVYAFSQGDTFFSWRTSPFVMFHPNGRYWIPPPINEDFAYLEKKRLEEKDRQMQEPKENSKGREMATGRQIERARMLRRRGRGQNRENPSVLDSNELGEFDQLVRKDLSLSRERICRAMAFCFDKCLAAKHIVRLLRDALLDDSPSVTIDSRIARLFLLSDILFNSQQPGIRNAFVFRSTIESMAPEIFSGLGKYRERSIGRITINKLRKAVSAVLGAWTDWGVYNATFMDELEAKFEGKQIQDENDAEEAQSTHLVDEVCSINATTIPSLKNSHIDDYSGKLSKGLNFDPSRQSNVGVGEDSEADLDGESIGSDGEDIDGSEIGEEDIDGEDIDGEDC
jgi:U2-associated protein SR140